MYLYGASGHAKVIIDILKALNIKIDALFDDDITINELLSTPVKHQWQGESPVIVSIGNNTVRKQIVDKLQQCDFATVRHPSAIISPNVRMGKGTVVMQGAIIQSGATIGSHCILNTGASVDHECIIEDFVHVSPQATLCGNVHVGEGAWIGAAAVVIPGVRIGKWSIVGAGSVVVQDVPDGAIAYGNPCRIRSQQGCCSGNHDIADDSAKRIAVYGAGGLGREVAGGIEKINKFGKERWNFIGFFDDNKQVGSSVSHYGEVLGGMEDLNSVSEPLALAIAIGDPRTRYNIQSRITNPNIYYPNLIAPSFKILDPSTFKIGQGNIIQEGCSATCDVTVGNFNVLNGSNVLGHDVVVGDFNVLMPAVRLSGAVRVGCCNLFGVDSVVLQKIHVGDNVTLGAGSVLMTKPKDGQTYIGVPAKKFEFE